MIVLIQNISFLKEFFCVQWLTFWCTFSAWFFHKNVPYLILCQLSNFQSQSFFPFQDIKKDVLLSFYSDNWWRNKLKDLSSIILYSDGRQGKKEGKTLIQKIEYLENEKTFSYETKGIFQLFKGYHLVEKWKVLDTSFKIHISDLLFEFASLNISLDNGRKGRAFNFIKSRVNYRCV